MRWIWFAAFLLEIATARGAAQDQVADEPAIALQPRADVQDLLFFAPSRPLLIRLHIRIDRQPIRELWRPDTSNAQQVSAAPENATAPQKSEQTPAGGHFFVEQVAITSRNAAPALFNLLDADGDGQLSAAELAAAESRLRCRDFDDDGLISAQELLRDQATDENGAPAAAAALILAVDPDQSNESLAAAILARYDRNRDGRLNVRDAPRELVISQEVLAQLDADGDGALDLAELSKFKARKPDIELKFAFGRGDWDPSERRGEAAEEFRLQRRLDGGYKLTISDAKIDFRRNNRSPADAAAQQYRFGPLDADGNGYLDETEAATDPLVASQFKAMDVDGDGKVFKEEFQALVTQKGKTAASQMLLEVSDQGQDLFSMIDANHDGVLSPRELHAAVELLRTQDVNGDGHLNSSEIPQQITLELSRGTDPRPVQTLAGSANRAVGPKPPTAGPAWFRKMDRNGDGDISRGEFLGPPDAFDRLDADHDGLISASEAESVGTH